MDDRVGEGKVVAVVKVVVRDQRFAEEGERRGRLEPESLGGEKRVDKVRSSARCTRAQRVEELKARRVLKVTEEKEKERLGVSERWLEATRVSVSVERTGGPYASQDRDSCLEASEKSIGG